MTEGKELMKGLGDKFQLLVDEIGSVKANKAVDNIQKLLDVSSTSISRTTKGRG